MAKNAKTAIIIFIIIIIIIIIIIVKILLNILKQSHSLIPYQSHSLFLAQVGEAAKILPNVLLRTTTI